MNPETLLATDDLGNFTLICTPEQMKEESKNAQDVWGKPVSITTREWVHIGEGIYQNEIFRLHDEIAVTLARMTYNENQGSYVAEEV